VSVSLEILEALAAAGGTAEQLLAVLRADRDLRVRRRCFRAIKAALFPVEQSPVFESGFAGEKADPEPDATYRTSAEKSAARAGLLASRLRQGAKAVGGRLLEHLNLETGRCDPSIGRMARDLGLDERSVRRSIGELEAAGLVARVINSGRGHANSYRLNLGAMGAIAAAVAPERRTHESANPDGRVLQNRGRKQLPSVVGVGLARERRKQHPPDAAQPQLLLPIVNRTTVAADAAVRRVMDAVESEARRQPSFNVSSLTPAQWADVHAAERHREGGGIGVIRQMLANSTATGPPAAAASG
jgi:hypothetical protein